MHAGNAQPVREGPGARVAALRPAPRPRPRPAARARFPDRYAIADRGRGRVLLCTEAPTVSVCLERGFSVSASTARSFGRGSIFLDGAAQGEPFADPEREVYNLDHHEGCVRAFTLSSCEQAMVLVRSGLDLRRRDWTVYANDADLDTVLAIWVLFNHLRLNEPDSPLRAEIMPLLRLQGAIDAHGLELEDLCALPPDLYRSTRARMDRLRAPELELKARGEWQTVDLLAYMADRLYALDRMAYPSVAFEGVAKIDEIARAEIGASSLVVACRSDAGIYEVERELRRIHGARLGVIALQKDATTWSLRQVDPALPATLETLYAHLNLVDPAAGGDRSANRWGGSSEIGGSPRSSGTRLAAQQIAEICRLAYARPTRLRRAGRALAATAIAAAVPLAALGVAAEGARARASLPALDPRVFFTATLCALAAVLLVLAARRTPRMYGLRRPVGLDWMLALPVALLGALAGGIFAAPVVAGAPPWAPAAGLLALAASTELLFRGLAQGLLARSAPTGRAGAGVRGRIWPLLGASALYAGALGAAQHCAPALLPPGALDLGAPLAMAGGLAFGLAAGFARQRAESVLAPMALHAVCAAALLTPVF